MWEAPPGARLPQGSSAFSMLLFGAQPQQGPSLWQVHRREQSLIAQLFSVALISGRES